MTRSPAALVPNAKPETKLDSPRGAMLLTPAATTPGAIISRCDRSRTSCARRSGVAAAPVT